MRPLERKLGHECGALLECVECPHEKKHENLLRLSALCHMKLEPEVSGLQLERGSALGPHHAGMDFQPPEL